MNLFEYQAKSLLSDAGLPAPLGRVATGPGDLDAALTRVPGPPWVLKAQVKAGGRGKGGGVKIVNSPDDAVVVAGAMMAKPLVTPQTGPEGVAVKKILVEPAVKIAKEMYLSILIDRRMGSCVALASAQGGVEIERLAEESPEKLLKLPFDARDGIRGYQARQVGEFLGLSGEAMKEFMDVLPALARFFVLRDCSLVEINPLVVTEQSRLVLLDAKVGLDDNALGRQLDLSMNITETGDDPREAEAAANGLSYVSLSGTIGCMVNGAGLAMSTLDLLKLHGGMPANFLDVGGGATKGSIVAAFKLLVGDPKVKSVLVNIFGGIMRCDLIAQGMVEAFREVKPSVPVVVRLEGTNKEEGMRLLNDSGLELTTAAGFDEAAARAVELSRR